MFDLVRNPEDTFSHIAAHINIKPGLSQIKQTNKKSVYKQAVFNFCAFDCRQICQNIHISIDNHYENMPMQYTEIFFKLL